MPYAAVVVTAAVTWMLFFALAARADTSTYPPTQTTPPPTTPTAHTGFEGQHDAARAGALFAVGVIALGGATFVARRRAKAFES